jgi:hypothetical protein
VSQVTIDLGEIRADPVPELEPPARGNPRIWFFVAVLLAVLAVGGAVTPANSLVEVRAVNYRTGQLFQLTNDRLYVVDRGSSRGARLVVYAAATGRGLWSIPLHWQPERLVPVEPAGLLLTVVLDFQASVTALDLATGQVRWHRDDRLVGVAPDLSAAVVSSASSQALDPGSDNGVMAVDLRTGEQRWALQWSAEPGVPRDEAFSTVSTVDGSGRWLVAVRRSDGTAQLLDGNTGRILATGLLPAPPPNSPSEPGLPLLAVTGDLLTVRYRDLDETVLDGYDLGTLGPRWHRLLAGDEPYLDACGRAVCAGGLRIGVTAIDPGTGRVLWTDALRSRAVQLPAHPNRSPARVLAFETPVVSELTARRVAVLDAQTGRRLADLGDWWWVPDSTSDTSAPRSTSDTLAPGSTSDRSDRAPGELLLARPGQAITSVFAVLDLPTLDRRELGVLPVQPFGCQATEARLVCPTTDGVLHIWRYQR